MSTQLGRAFLGNAVYAKHMLKNMNDEDMMLCTGESNTIGWILGHIVYYRGEIAKKLNKECAIKDYEKNFERGAEKNREIKVSLADALKDLTERGEIIAGAIEEMGEEGLKKKIDIELPGGDGSIGNYIAFLSWHETFHLGQIDLIKAACGKGGIK